MKSLIKSIGKLFLKLLIVCALLAGLSLPTAQAQQNNQSISQPDLAIVSGIESMSDATKDALTARGFLVKKKIGQTWHYELETIVYRSFPPNAELFFVYQSNDTLLWSGGRDIVEFDARLGLEVLPGTTIVNTWQLN